MANRAARNPWRADWAGASPMLEALLGAGRAFAGQERWPALAEYNALLDPPIHTASGAALRFVAQDGRPASMEQAYEARIYRAGEVQTRSENWHDFFNALVWLAFPHTKTALNARHFEAMAGGARERGRARDALTLFDESGVAVLYADPFLADLLRAHRWQELFWSRRREVQEGMKFVVFGHSLHEKALKPYIGLTGKGLLVPAGADFFTLPLDRQGPALDAMLAARFARGAAPGSGDLVPVPLLGVPGWWPANGHPAFYGNTSYFRPRRAADMA